MPDSFVRRVLTVVGISTGIILLVLFIWQAVTVLLMLFAGVLFGVILIWLKRLASNYLKLPSALALTLVVLSVLGFLAVVITSVTPMIVEQTRTLLADLPSYIEGVRAYLLQFEWGRTLLTQAPSAEELLNSWESSDQDIVSRIVGVFSTTLGALAGLVLVIFIGIYLAAEPGLYTDGILRLLPRARRARGREVLGQLAYTIRWWLLGQMLSMLILGVLTTVGLAVLGIPYPLALGLLAAIMTFIPNLGPVLAFIPTMVVALANSPEAAVYVFFLYLLIQNVEGYFITPLVHRRIIAMPPVVILTVQILLLTLVGFVGVLLAMPLVACAMVLIRTLYVEDVLGDSFERPV